MAVILNLAMLDSAILVSPLKLTHTYQDWFPIICTKKTSLIHSDSTWWWQPSWTLPWWIQTLPSWIKTPCYLLSDSLKNTLTPFCILTQTNSIQLTRWWQPSWILPSWIQPFCTKKFPCSFWLNFKMAAILNSVILDSAILHKKNFTHSFWLNLMMAANLNSAMLDSYTAILDSNTLLSSLRFTQKHSHSILHLTQTNSIQLTRWWQP